VHVGGRHADVEGRHPLLSLPSCAQPLLVQRECSAVRGGEEGVPGPLPHPYAALCCLSSKVPHCQPRRALTSHSVLPIPAAMPGPHGGQDPPPSASGGAEAGQEDEGGLGGGGYMPSFAGGGRAKSPLAGRRAGGSILAGAGPAAAPEGDWRGAACPPHNKALALTELCSRGQAQAAGRRGVPWCKV